MMSDHPLLLALVENWIVPCFAMAGFQFFRQK
jgi:hypothetical protein